MEGEETQEVQEVIPPYTILDNNRKGYEDYDSCYQGLLLPGGKEVWLTEPEDRTFYRDLSPLVEHVRGMHKGAKKMKQTIKAQQEQLESFLKRIAQLESELKTEQIFSAHLVGPRPS